MAVIINDFEVVAEPPAQANTGGAAPEAQPAGPPPALIIIQVIRTQRERAARLRAH